MNIRFPSQGAGDVRAAMQPRGPAGVGKIEKARDPRHALTRVLAYLRPFRTAMATVLACVLIYTVLGLIGPYLMGVAIDRFIVPKRLTGLARIAVWMLVVYLLYNLFQAVAGRVMASVSQRALKQLRRDLFDHLQTLPIRFFDHNPAGELMSRLTNDIDAINQAVSQNVTSLLASVLSLVGILVAMFALDRWLALASVLVVPIMFWFANFVARYTRRGFRELQKRLGELNGLMEEAISGQKVITAFRRNESALADFRQRNEAVFRAGVYANSYALLLMPLTSVLGNFFVIVLAGLGGWLALRGLVSVGIIATFIIYGQNFIQPLRQLANMYNAIQAALAGAERVFEILDTPSEVDDAEEALPLTAVRGQVRFERVSFAYEPGVPIIQDMTLEARAGQTVALVGPDRGRKDDPHQPPDPLLRDPGGQDHGGRHGHPGHPEGRPAPPARPGPAGHLPVLRHRDGEHPLRAARRHRRGVHPGRADGRRRPLHPATAPGLPDAPLGAGQQPQPGPASAPLHRPRHPRRSGHSDPG